MNEMTDLPHELLSFKSDFDEPTEIIVNENEVESTMTDQVVHYLLDEIIKKKKDLHDPRHRCNRFFGEIRDIFIAEYELFFSIRTLERKYHYLKRHFDTLCQNNSRGNVGSKGSGEWPYYDKMMEIFAEELDIEDAPTMASLYPALPLPKTALPVTQGVREGSKKVGELPPDEDIKPSIETQEENTQETIWNHAVVLDFLNLCVKKRPEFWDPSYRRRDIFIDIQGEMKAKGYNFKLESLDRKLKNLKSCYHLAAQSVRKKPTIRNGRTRWPYFAQLDEIYNGFKENRVARKITGRKAVKRADSLVRRKYRRGRLPKQELPCTSSEALNLDVNPTSSTQYRPIRCKPEPIEEFHVPAQDAFEYDDDRGGSFSPGDLDCLIEADETRTDEDLETKAVISTEPMTTTATTTTVMTSTAITSTAMTSTAMTSTATTSNGIADDLEFAQKMLALEERRTIATEQLLEQLKESNRIREKKIAFNRNKLKYLMARAKRKNLF